MMPEEKPTKVISYTLELRQPVLATDVQGEPNGAVSLPYISGALLRGALVARYLKREGGKSFDAGSATARALFLGETTRYLNAYPLDKGCRRMLPVPASWRHDKEAEPPAEDSEDLPEIHDLSRGRRVKEEAVGGVFYSLEERHAALCSPPRQLNVHTQRDARKGRATEASGAVYRYDALAAGTLLRAAVLTDAECAGTLVDLLDKATLFIGRARRAGYGEVLVQKVEQLDFWRETEDDESPRAIVAGGQLQITFTSDALLRDTFGQATLNPRAALAEALGIEPEKLAPQAELCFAKARVVGGFNRKWGLPLPQATTLAAGSVFIYEVANPIEAKALATLERNGIGERRNEGCGRLLVNWPPRQHAKFEARVGELAATLPPLAALADEEKSAAELIARRILRRQLEEKLRERVNMTKISRRPSNSQLARLRVTLRALRQKNAPGGLVDVAPLLKYLDDLDKRRSSRTKFAQSYVGGADLRDWIKEQLDQAEEKWKVDPIRLGKGEAAVVAEVDQILAQEYALRLVDQTLHRATKERE